MRKALISMFLAATILTPVAAQAQDSDDSRRAAIQQRYERQAQRNQQRHEQRQQRQEAREQRQTQRAERREEAPAAVPQQRQQRQQRRAERTERRQQQQAAPVAVSQRQRGEFRRDRDRQLPSTTGWQGPRNDPSLRDEAARYDRRARENAVRYGTREQRQEVRQERREDRREWRQDRREDRRDWRQDRREARRDWRREWNRDSWRSDRRYDWQSWRYRNRNIFRVSPYYSPYRNHHYSRFSIGFFLDSLFYNQRYWISDPWQYRLPPAPYGTQWVRYYDDVLLVDVYTGEVVDVIHNFFW